MDKLTYYLIYEIFEKLSFISKLRFRALNSIYHHHKKFQITDLYHIEWEYKKKLNDHIIKLFPYCEKLNAESNPDIMDVSHLINNLKTLNCSLGCGINQQSIVKLTNLVNLLMRMNDKIEDISYLKNLKKLDCSALLYGVNWDNLNLTILITDNTVRIDDFSHMTNLKYLSYIGYDHTLSYDLRHLNLIYLNVYENSYLTKIPYMSKLKYLNIGFSNIGPDGIEGFKLKKLDVYNNKLFNNVDIKKYLR